jgi:hypothetical protein
MRLAPVAIAICSTLSAACGASMKANTYTATLTFYSDAAFVEEGETDPEVLEAAGEKYEVEDCLSVELASDESKLKYSFSFNFPFDHECSMSGMADKVGPGKWVQEFALAGDDAGMCRLEIERDAKGTWTVQDAANCREEFCGARGHIGHSFPASAKGPLKKCGYGD